MEKKIGQDRRPFVVSSSNMGVYLRRGSQMGAALGVTSASELLPNPTVMVATTDRKTRMSLAKELRRDNCLVLEADGVDWVLDVVKTHSRSIHVLLLDLNLGDSHFADLLKGFRPDLEVVFMTPDGPPGSLSPDHALAKAKRILRVVNRT